MGFLDMWKKKKDGDTSKGGGGAVATKANETAEAAPAQASSVTEPEQPTSTPEQPPSHSTYTVAEGDTLWAIAQAKYGDGSQWQKIYDANVGVIGPNPDAINVGTQLVIPE